jgi:hypothetical protein
MSPMKFSLPASEVYLLPISEQRHKADAYMNSMKNTYVQPDAATYGPKGYGFYLFALTTTAAVALPMAALPS